MLDTITVVLEEELYYAREAKGRGLAHACVMSRIEFLALGPRVRLEGDIAVVLVARASRVVPSVACAVPFA